MGGKNGHRKLVKKHNKSTNYKQHEGAENGRPFLDSKHIHILTLLTRNVSKGRESILKQEAGRKRKGKRDVN